MKINVSKNGPYLVDGNIPLKEENIDYDVQKAGNVWVKGKDFPNKKNYALCRCGKSTNKPYCTGAHLKEKFDGTETADHEKFIDKAQLIEGPQLDLLDAGEFCVGAGFCHRAQGVWQAVEESDDANAKKIAIEESCNCPSGRLVACKKSGEKIEPRFTKEISVVKNSETEVDGPLWIKGGIEIKGADGKPYETRNRVTLCRCGRSKNKPFCDGSHIQ